MAPLSLGAARGNASRVGASGIGWFSSAVRPDVPRGLGEYRGAPPRGMTNPPQNPLVRQALLKDLLDYNIVLRGAEQWPPPAPLRSSSSTPAAYGPLPELDAPLAGRPVATGSDPLGPRFRGGLGRGSRTLAAAGAQSLPQLERNKGAAAVSLAHAPAEASRPRGGAMPVSKPVAQTASSSTARARGRSDLRINCDTGRESVDASGSVSPKSTVSTEKRHSAFAAQEQGVAKMVLSEGDLDSAIDVLRSRGRAHRVTLDSRFRQSAEESAEGGGSMLQGAQWQSDGTHLVSHHNRAMRHHNPSRLDKLKKQQGLDRLKKQQQKKRLVEDDVDEHSPLAKYPSDTSLHALRDLQMKLAPPVAEAVSPEAEVEQKKVDVAFGLKGLLKSTFSLHHFKEPSGDE